MDLAVTSFEALAAVVGALFDALATAPGIWRIAMSILMTLGLAGFAWYQRLIETPIRRSSS